MKARFLKKLLNNTGYTVAFYDDYIGIGSPLCHDLIKVEIPSFNMTYALAWPAREGRKSLNNKEELAFIWDKLGELIKSGEINDILSGKDELENPLPVYTVRFDTFISTTTDEYGWPNVTAEGYLMHDNTYFDNPIDALNYGIKQMEYREEACISHLQELDEKRQTMKNRIQETRQTIESLKLLIPNYSTKQ